MLHINYQYLSLSITVGERGEQKLVYIKGKIDITPPCKAQGFNYLMEQISYEKVFLSSLRYIYI